MRYTYLKQDQFPIQPGFIYDDDDFWDETFGEYIPDDLFDPIIDPLNEDELFEVNNKQVPPWRYNEAG